MRKITKQLITVDIDKLIPYEYNARENDTTIDNVAKSIKECGYIAPIIVDENYEILCGHARREACLILGIDELQVYQVYGLTEQEKRKFRIVDNKTSELADWDYEILLEESYGIDFSEYDFDLMEVREEEKKEEKAEEVDTSSSPKAPMAKFGKRKIPLTEEESEKIQRMYEEYVNSEEHGTGFIKWLTNWYD